MQAVGINSLKWKSVRDIIFEYYYRYNNQSIYTVDVTLNPIVVPENCIIVPTNNTGYFHSYNGSVQGKFTIEDSTTARLTYIGYLAQNGGTQGPLNARARIYEYPKAFKSSQIVTSQGTSIELPQGVDWTRSLYVRSWIHWRTAAYGAAIGIVDSNHIAQGNNLDFGSYVLADQFIRGHIVEF